MERWPTRKMLVLLLGVFLALGVGISAVQAGEMAVQMTLASGMGSSGSGGCTGCGGNDDGAAAGSCHPVCTVAAVAVLPLGPVVVVARSERPALPAKSGFPGRASSPDPFPPKEIALG